MNIFLRLKLLNFIFLSESHLSKSVFDSRKELRKMKLLQQRLFQDQFEVGREALWIGEGETFSPKQEFEAKYKKDISSFDQTFFLEKDKPQISFRNPGVMKEDSNPTRERNPNAKRKRKSMAVLNFKKFKFTSRTKRRHFEHENKTKQKTLFSDAEQIKLQEPTEYFHVFKGKPALVTPMSANVTLDIPNFKLEKLRKQRYNKEFTSNSKGVYNKVFPSSPSLTQKINITEKWDKEKNLKRFGKLSVSKNSTKHINLQELEKELIHNKNNHDLLFAISILQHHVTPEQLKERDGNTKKRLEESKMKKHGKKYSNFFESTKKNSEYKLFNNHSGHLKKENKPQASFNFKVEINNSFSNKKDIFEELNQSLLENSSLLPQPTHKSLPPQIPKPNLKQDLHWFILVMEGDCTIIRQRMSSFVTFLKAALSAKLEASYEDIYVPSVFCHKTFMVNISIDLIKYPRAAERLRTLAETNTTLFELSGEIFYLEKILQGKALEKAESISYLDRTDDIKIVIYFSVGCMCIFIFLSVVIVSLIKLCRQDDPIPALEKEDPPKKPDIIPARRPNVIYSHNFTQSLVPEKYRLNLGESSVTEVPSDNDATSGQTQPAAHPSSRPILRPAKDKRSKDGISDDFSGERKFANISSSSSKFCLLEEVREEEEEEEDTEEEEEEENYKENDVNDDDDEHEDGQVEEGVDGDEENKDNHDEKDEDDEDGEKDEDTKRNVKGPFKTRLKSIKASQDKPTTSPPSLYKGIRSFCLPSSDRELSESSSSSVQTSFENPCYER